MNNLRYYLENEHEEKWSMAWRLGLLDLVYKAIYIVFLGLFFTHNIELFFIMLVPMMIFSFFVTSIRQKILFDQVISKYFDGKKIPLKPVYKKILASMVIGIGMLIGFGLPLFILMMIKATASNGLVLFLMFIAISAINVIVYVIKLIVSYAIFETLGTDNFGFGSFFPVWSSMMKTYFKKVVIGVVKTSVLFILGCILYLMILTISEFIIDLTSDVLYLSILMPIYESAKVGLPIAGIVFLRTASYQYLMNIRFNKDSNIE